MKMPGPPSHTPDQHTNLLGSRRGGGGVSAPNGVSRGPRLGEQKKGRDTSEGNLRASLNDLRPAGPARIASRRP